MAVNLVSGATAALNATAQNASTSNAASIAVLKKALDLQSQSASQLLQALPQPPASKLPHLGNHLNAVA